jgi:hypothetical protein
MAYHSAATAFLLILAGTGFAQQPVELAKLPANSWVEIKPQNPIPPHTSWMGWMQLCYDPDDDCFIGKIREKFYAFRYEPAP